MNIVEKTLYGYKIPIKYNNFISNIHIDIFEETVVVMKSQGDLA